MKVRFFERVEPVSDGNDHFMDVKRIIIEKSNVNDGVFHSIEAVANSNDFAAFPTEYAAFLAAPDKEAFEAFKASKEEELKAEFESEKHR